MAGQFNFSGLASGLDTRALIDAIMSVERRPIQRLERQQVTLASQKNAFDDLRSKLNTFLGKLRDLATERTFRGRVATVTDETRLAATPGTAAIPGAYSIEISSLASASKVKSAGFAASDEAAVGDGTITLQSGDNDPIVIEVSAAAENNDLQSIRNAINDADAGVAATILFDGTVHRLVVRSEETGAENALAISDSTTLGLTAVENVVTTAADASLSIDGIAITSASNTVSAAIEGVTLNLLAPTEDAPVILQVQEDVDGAIEAVQSLVDGYNEVIGFFTDQLDTSDPGPLARDGHVRRLRAVLQSLATSGLEEIPAGGIRSLSAIGVDFDGRSGRLSLDTGELRELLETRYDEVGDLFLAADTGSSGLLDGIIDELTLATRTGDGTIAVSREIIDSQARRLSDEILRLEQRMVGREARLMRTFSAAERAISVLQQQQGQLGGFVPL